MKKNVLIISQKLYGGGAERTASNLSLFLQKEYNIHLAVFDGTDTKYPYGGQFHDLKCPARKGAFGKIFNICKRIHAINKIKRDENIAATISLLPPSNFINVLTRNSDRIITSIRIQTSKSRFDNVSSKIWTKQTMKFVNNRSDYIVALSKGVEKDLVDNFGANKNKVVTIYNPCDGEMLKEKALVHLADAKKMPEHSITTMGRFTEQKGQWHLIRALVEVKKSIPDIKLYVLGDGPLKERLEGLTKELHLEENVEFLGFVEAPHAYIMKSKVFVFPSLYEGLGNVLLEAMACGTPCISTDCYSGPREILAPGTDVREKLKEIEYAQFGVLTSVGDKGPFEADTPVTVPEKQMADAIIELLVNDKKRKKYHQAALERIKDFSPESITKDWMRLIEG